MNDQLSLFSISVGRLDAASRTGSIYGDIHVSFGALELPGAAYQDFVVPVLGWWLQAVDKLRRGNSVEDFAILRFMDTPNVMTVTRVSQRFARCCFWENDTQKKMLACDDFLLDDIYAEIVRACRQVVRSIGSNVRSGDLEQLRDLVGPD